MKNVVILEIEKYNELINNLEKLKKENDVLFDKNIEKQHQINLWVEKVDRIEEQFKGLFDTIIREDILGTDEVIISDINDRDKIAEYINNNLKLEFNELKEKRKCK
ncbi:MAG: hypothetical protein SOZ53_02295 [Candidatus Onthovivens sp.]|nr:hypothetical protein [Candidatus Onthovivens sp.]